MVSSRSTDRRAASLLRVVVGEEPLDAPTPATWPEWLEFARRERVVPLLHQLVEHGHGELDDAQHLELREAQVEVMSVAAQHDRHLLEVSQTLASVDVRAIALKGAAVANLDYPDPSWRQYGDLDILIPERDLHRACDTLGDTGWTEWYPLPERHRRFAHAITLTRGQGWELDVHQRLAHRAIGRMIPVDLLVAGRSSLRIAGTLVWALGADDRLLHAALHAELSHGVSRRLSSVGDVLLLASAMVERAPTILARANAWSLRPMIERSIASAFVLARLAVPEGWSEAMTVPAHRDRLVELTYGGDRRHRLLEEVLHARTLSSWRDRWTYLSAFVSTGEDYAARQGRDLRAQLAYLRRRLRDQ